MKYFDYESGYGKLNEFLLAEIKKSLITIKSELYSRKLSKYDDWVYPSYVLSSTKGFQLIKVISKEEVKTPINDRYGCHSEQYFTENSFSCKMT